MIAWIRTVALFCSGEVVLRRCYECGGTGSSPRGYGDSSLCGTCDGHGWIRSSRWDIIYRIYSLSFHSKWVLEYWRIRLARKRRLPLLLGHVQFKVNQEYLEERLKR